MPVAIGIGVAIPFKVTQTGGAPMVVVWILTTGFWDDDGVWDDAAVWID